MAALLLMLVAKVAVKVCGTELVVLTTSSGVSTPGIDVCVTGANSEVESTARKGCLHSHHLYKRVMFSEIKISQY